MKTILLPTDFSKASLNAIDYAAQLAKLTKAEIILFHVYNIPIITSDVPIVVPSIVQIEKDSLDALKKIKKNIIKKYDLKSAIECKVASGFAVDEINSYSKEKKADLIVMGMQGNSYLAEKIAGSVTTSLMRKASCSVLSIDNHVKFKTIKKIVLACDYNENSYLKLLDTLKEFTKIFKSHVFVLNVVPELETTLTVIKAVGEIKLENALEEIEYSFDEIQNEDVIEGINNFVSKQTIDLVAMIPHHRSLLKNIFQSSSTKKMAFHTHVPLLALH